VTQLNSRFKGHRKGLKTPDKYEVCRILTTHFTEGICKGAHYTVQILEKLEGDGRTDRRVLDASITAKRKSRELDWMLKLRTVFPYGLNDEIGSEYKNEDRSCIGRIFPPLKRNFSRISRGAKRKSSNGLSAKDFFRKFQELLVSNIKDSLNFLRVSITSMKKAELKRLADILCDGLLEKVNSFPYCQWYSAALDCIDCRL